MKMTIKMSENLELRNSILDYKGIDMDHPNVIQMFDDILLDKFLLAGVLDRDDNFYLCLKISVTHNNLEVLKWLDSRRPIESKTVDILHSLALFYKNKEIVEWLKAKDTKLDPYKFDYEIESFDIDQIKIGERFLLSHYGKVIVAYFHDYKDKENCQVNITYNHPFIQGCTIGLDEFISLVKCHIKDVIKLDMATKVKALRELTGAGMMNCKKALAECEGDEAKAILYLRNKSMVIGI